MILTGKALEEFIIWVAYYHGLCHDEFIKLGNRTKLVLYRDFFRDFGITTEATEKAIERALKIFNGNH